MYKRAKSLSRYVFNHSITQPGLAVVMLKNEKDSSAVVSLTDKVAKICVKV